jgi:hypothetical protein
VLVDRVVLCFFAVIHQFRELGVQFLQLRQISFSSRIHTCFNHNRAIFTVSSVIAWTTTMRMSCSVNSRRLAGSAVPDNLTIMLIVLLFTIVNVLGEGIFNGAMILQ